MALNIFLVLCHNTTPIAKSLGSHIISNSLFQSSITMMGAVTNLVLILSNSTLHNSSKSKFASFSSSPHNGLEIFEKSFMNLLKNIDCCKWQESFYDSNFCLVYFQSSCRNLVSKTIPSITMKWHFSQFKARFLS